MDRAKKLDMIRGLLAKAEASTSEAEREAFTRGAQERMMRLGVEEAELNATRPRHDQDQIITYTEDAKGRWGLVNLVFYNQIIAALGTVQLVRHKTTAVQQMWLIGYESDVTIARMLAGSLMAQAQTALAAWEAGEGRELRRRSTAAAVFSARREFILAFSIKAASKITASRQTMAEDITPGNAVALVDRAQQVDNYVRDKVRNPRKNPVHRSPNQAANWAGSAAGADARIGQSELDGRRALASR